MSRWDGVFRCDKLGVDNCVVWWDAIAAVGAWAAAIVTFLAVLLPFLAMQRKEALRSRIALVEFELVLRDLERRVGLAMIHLDVRRKEGTWVMPEQWGALRLPPLAHSVEPSRRCEYLLMQLSLLRVRMNDWNSFIEPYTELSNPDPDFQKSMVDLLLTKLGAVRRELAETRLQFEKLF